LTQEDQFLKIPISRALWNYRIWIIVLAILLAALGVYTYLLQVDIAGKGLKIQIQQKEIDRIEKVRAIMRKSGVNDPAKLSIIMNTWTPVVMARLIYRESGFNSLAVSEAGALGDSQVMPFWFKCGEDPFDPRINISRGAEILREYYLILGNMPDAIWAYNAGIGRVIEYYRYGRTLPAETVCYRANIEKDEREGI
jgi:hypothetical protein